MARGTKKFGGVPFYLIESELTKTAAQMEAKRQRKAGYKARVVQRPASVRAVKGHAFAVYARKR